MKRWPSTKVMVEGHADSRGTAEYNLALGERRAAAVRDYLVNLGIGADRITVVSKGKEAPVCTRRERSLLVAEPPRPLRDHGEVARQSAVAGQSSGSRTAALRLHRSAIASAACLGSGAAMIGRPTTR